ncbi:LysR family transcriptional regulator [Terasakiella sp. A23]|uniref:LysR family transcriptional regulator n=1 Tax=Terasakiella sp. FCG-A23 TaxID=3080561 RepID=UPI002953B23A|nr:LysR family transcriptional regulator [Terasakiella sp. A23]MDV7341042.1 LysR family transcriptional regulator [Terasakiella sp. A23]
MDTNGIRLFVMAADMLNISKAGRQLGLSPAVAGAKLSKLEKQLGADLLHRSTRKISLSLEGEEFLPFAREIIAQEDAAHAALGHGSKEIKGTLRFTASSTFAQLFIAPILPEFLERYPQLKLDLKLSDAQTNLIEGGYDLALRNYAIEDSSLKARKIANDKRILCASPTYLDQYGVPETPEDLSDHRILTFNYGAPKKMIADDDAPEATFPPAQSEKHVMCDDGTSMRISTVAGLGISMNSIWSIHRELKDGSLVRVLPNYEVADRSAIWLVYPKSNILTAKVRVFIDYLLEKIGTPPIWER